MGIVEIKVQRRRGFQLSCECNHSRGGGMSNAERVKQRIAFLCEADVKDVAFFIGSDEY